MTTEFWPSDPVWDAVADRVTENVSLESQAWRKTNNIQSGITVSRDNS